MLETVTNIPQSVLSSVTRPEDAKKALDVARKKGRFHGSKITVYPHDGFASEEAGYLPPEAELDEYHHKATRTLFVGNLDGTITKDQLHEVFKVYGPILVRF